MPLYQEVKGEYVLVTEEEAIDALSFPIPIYVTELNPGEDIYRYAVVYPFHVFDKQFPHLTPKVQKMSMYCNFIAIHPEDEEIIGVFQQSDKALDAAFFWLHSEQWDEVVPRSSNDEKTFAFVTARVTKDYTHRSLLYAVTEAVTEWVNTTENGKTEWENSCHDLNVGDLSAWTEDEELIIILRKHGIRDLKIETYVDIETSAEWTYDTVLATEDSDLPELDDLDEDEE